MVFDSYRSGKLNLTMLVKTDSIRAYEYDLYLGTLIFVGQIWRQTCIRNNIVIGIYPRKQKPCFEIGERDFRMRLQNSR